MKSAMALVRNMLPGRDADPDAIAAQIANTRHVIETHRAEYESLATAWRDADTAEDADKIERRRRECLRLAERGEAAMPGMEAALVAARATKQRVALAKHLAAARAVYFKLRDVVEIAASVQHEAILVRQAAIAELSEGVVQQRIGAVAYMGILLPDLVEIWRAHQDRVFAEPATVQAVAAVVAPVPAKPAVKPAPAAPVPPTTEPAKPKPRREPRRDKVSVGGRLVTILRTGVEIGDQQLHAGDQISVSMEQAELLLRNGAAELVNAS
jgi:hypothetical protein